MADPQNPETKAAETPKALTAEDVNKIVNDALTAREKRAEERATKAAKAVEEKATADREAAEAAAAEGGGARVVKTGDAAADRLAEVEERAKRLEDKLAREGAARKAEAKAREAEREKALRDEETLKVTEMLKGANIPEARIKGVLALFTVDKRIARDASGAIIYKVDEDESVPLSEGVKRFLDSDDGKQYLPSRGASGAGIQRGNVLQRGGTPAEAKAARMDAARRSLHSAIRRPG